MPERFAKMFAQGVEALEVPETTPEELLAQYRELASKDKTDVINPIHDVVFARVRAEMRARGISEDTPLGSTPGA